MKQRRNPFQKESIHLPETIYDNLRVAERRQRNRKWEKAAYQNKAVYRGVDPHLALRVKEIAGDLLVNSGEVARILLEYALRAYAECELELNPRPHPERSHWTLYPTETISERRSRGGSRRKPKKQTESRWKVLTTWRGFPVALKNEIAALACEDGLNVPVGELVSALLRFSLKAYEYGLLKLEPVQKVAGYTLQEEAQS